VAPEHADVNMDEQDVLVRDASHKDFMLTRNGFEIVNLKSELLPVFERISQEGLSGLRGGPVWKEMWSFGGRDETTMVVEELLARKLQGVNTYDLKDHISINLQCSGFVIRKGSALARQVNGMGFDMVAQRVHIDTDVEGEPLRSLGMSWMFFYASYLHILNVWTPLKTPALQPLGVVDIRTQPQDKIARTRANSTKNAAGNYGSFAADRLMTMYDENMKWWWFPEMQFGQSIVFLTDKTAHSAFTIFEDERALANYLDILISLRTNGNKCPSILPDVPSEMTPNAARLMLDVVEATKVVCQDPSSKEKLREDTIDSISRSSLEIRCATMVIPQNHIRIGAVLVFFLSITLLRRCTRPRGYLKLKTS